MIDTGFWIALYEERDTHHAKASEQSEYLTRNKILIPFPSLYETVNTRFAKRADRMADFGRIIQRHDTALISDEEYKDDALRLTMDYSIKQRKPYSLVDMIIRLMLFDNRMNIKYLLTFNKEDFLDVCINRNITVLPE
jgi:predicted nucleic acid-binding protein